MKIIINTAVQRFGGAVQVALSFIHECIAYPENQYHILVGSGLKSSLNRSAFPDNFYFYEFDFGVITMWKTYKVNNRLRSLEKEIKPDVIIATSGPTYFNSQAPQIIGYNLPLYIYPESPFLEQLSIYRTIRLMVKKSIHFYFFNRDATAYIVQTEDVNQRVRKSLKTNDVNTVTNTHSSLYYKWKKFPNKLPNQKSDELRLITLSSWYYHKNLELIAEIIDLIAQLSISNITFVLTLEQSKFEELFDSHHLPFVFNVGPINPKECPSLYAECDFMFLPTLAECFSASYPEAMVMEKPIITSDLGFARSICKDAALYYTPMDATAALNAILSLSCDPEMQKDLINKGKKRVKNFDSPCKRAEKYLNLCQMIVKRQSKNDQHSAVVESF